MAKGCNDVSRIICANTIKENEHRLLEARIKSQGKKTNRQDLSKLFNKLNQSAFEANTLENAKLSCLSSYKRNVIKYWYGPIPEFPPGSWWGIRMDCSRDRVHDPFDIDIHEGPYGVISVCTSHGDINEDIDDGDFLTLTGQIYCEKQPDTDPFIRNYKNQIPLRLIRSYNLQNHIAPNTGYRYDGLYVIIGSWIGMNSDGIKCNKFALMRLAEQESPTWDSRNLKGKNCSSSVKNRISSTQSNCSKSQNSNAYNLRKSLFNTDTIYGKEKCNHRNNHENLLTAKTIELIENKKPVSESSIVTRHVFKKTNNIETKIPGTTFLPEQKTLCLGTSAPKTHSTNISIRMGLYESPYNVQDVKRNISTILHKPFKPIDIANRTALDIDAHLIPKKNDKLGGTTNMNNTQNNSPLIENDTSCDVSRHVTNNNTEELVDPPNKRRRNLCCEVPHTSYTILSSINNHNNNINHPKLKEQLQNQQFLDTSTQNVNVNNELKKNVSFEHQDTSERAKKCLSVQDMKSLKSLDSLTPDKILNLINKKKHQPLSKLLIGNVIGLTFEECTMLNTSKVIASDSKSKVCTLSKINHRKRKIKENATCLSEDVLNRRYCKYSKSKRLSWKVMKHADIERLDKIPNVNYKSRNNTTENRNSNVRIKARSGIPKENCLPPYHIQASFKAVTQHSHCTYNIKTRLRADKGGVLTKQEFSNATVKKNRYKKHDREIANLLIDANIGPKRRGPRNRRLRCINNTYMNKRCCNTFNSKLMYHSGKSNRITEKQRYKSNFKRKNKLTKINHQCAREEQSKDMYTMSRSLRTKRDNGHSKDIKNLENVINNSNEDRNYNNINDNNKNNTRKSTITDTSNCNIPKASFKGRLRKQLVQAIPLQIPRYTSQVSSHLRYFHEQVVKPTTTDATTQCRLISEGTIANIRQKRMQNMKNKKSASFSKVNDQMTSIKMEWDKVKSESVRNVMYNDRNSEISRRFTIPTFTENNTHHKDDEDYTDSSRFLCEQSANDLAIRERYVNSVKDRTSAFVPVNAFDSDLRIARLRSIGFKPILKPQSPIVMGKTVESIQSNWKNTVLSTSKVVKRDVAEEYDKYTNEDSNIVVYMDDELQYQDIEQEEDENALGKEYIKSRRNVPKKSELRNTQSKHDTSSESISLHKNLESPWHGWKKIVKNNKSYWIGW